MEWTCRPGIGRLRRDRAVKTTLAAVVLAVCIGVSARGQEVAAGEGLTLTQAIAVALAREPTARAARLDVDIARGMRRQAKLRANPALSLEQREEPGGTDSATDIGIEWPLELFRRGPRVAVADEAVTVAEHEEADVRRQLAADVAAIYGEAAAAIRELAIIDDLLGAADNQLELLRARAAQGAAPALDRDMVDVEVRRIRA